MYAIVILSILVSGFLYIFSSTVDRLKLHRYDGQLLYLKCAYHGTLCFTGTLTVLIWVTSFNTNSNLLLTFINFYNSLNVKTGFPYETLVLASFLTVLVSFLYPKLLNETHRLLLSVIAGNLIDKESFNKYLKRHIYADSPIDNLFMESMWKKSLIMLTLSDRKVYVGVVLKCAEATENQPLNQEITIRPLWSGYRDKDSLEVIQTTVYPKEFEASIVIKQSFITTASKYNEDLYGHFSLDKALAKKMTVKKATEKLFIDWMTKNLK